MKFSTKLLLAIVGLGLSYSFYKLFTGQGGGGLGDFIDGLGYTSILIFIGSLLTIIINFRRLKEHIDTFAFLSLGLPMSVMAANGLIEYLHNNRTPDLIAKYPRPVSQKVFSEDSSSISIQVDSLVELANRNTHVAKIASKVIDTIIYSQSGNQIFVVYACRFERNDFSNDLNPRYLSANERDSIYWHLYEGSPNHIMLSGSYHDLPSLKIAVRKFYFNQFSFVDDDSLKKNYFWKINRTN